MSQRLRKWLFKMKEEIGIGILLLWFFAFTSVGQVIWNLVVPSKAELERDTFQKAMVDNARRNQEMQELVDKLVSEQQAKISEFYAEQMRFIKETREEDPKKLEKMKVQVPDTMADRLKKRLGEEWTD